MHLATTTWVDDPVLDRLRDRLPENLPYEGLVAVAYDAWIGVDDVFLDDQAYEAVLAKVDGPVLELGCGTGRPLLRWLAAGYDVEGVDGSADMLSILQSHAEERQLEPVVHHGDIAPLDLDGRSYAAILCPAETFTLIVDEDRIRSALESYWIHLRRGGVLGLSLSAHGDPRGRHDDRHPRSPPPGAEGQVSGRVQQDRDVRSCGVVDGHAAPALSTPIVGTARGRGPPPRPRVRRRAIHR